MHMLSTIPSTSYPKFATRRAARTCSKPVRIAAKAAQADRVHSGDPGGPQLLYSATSVYSNNIQVIQSMRGARILILDKSGNINSMYKKETYITNSYWDYLATFPQFCSEGTIGILGLGAGTVARTIAEYYPDVRMVGWEIDPVVVMAARLCFGIDDLEDDNVLNVKTGDALDTKSSVPGGFDGIVVDLFLGGKLVEAWRGIKQRLKHGVGAKVMVNLGVSPFSTVEQGDETILALDSMLEVFDGGCNRTVGFTTRESSEVPPTDLRAPTLANAGSPKLSSVFNYIRSITTIALCGPMDGLQGAWETDLPDDLGHLGRGYVWQRWVKADAPEKSV
eukprot:gene8117-1365_t